MTMTSIDQQEQRFASFILDCESAIEFAIHADAVIEATPVIGRLQPLPASVPYLEGLMHLRDDAIPVINMKKRLGLPSTDYGTDAKVAVVHVGQLRLGLLFDDIKEVLVVGTDAIEAVHPVFQDGEGIISDLIKLDDGRRTMELLDLKRLLGHGEPLETFSQAKPVPDAVAKTYSRFVIFTSLGQDYGVPVEQVQEITFLSKIDDVFKNDAIEGVVALRGHPVPVLSTTRLLQTQSRDHTADEDTRVLILNAETFQYGVIADSVREIISIPDDAIMALPRSGHATVNGIYQRSHGANIMLLQVDTLIEVQAQELQSVARLKTDQEEEQWTVGKAASRHLITADCYLIFSIGRNFAIKLNDVQEIIEPRDLLTLPSATGFDRRVLNPAGAAVVGMTPEEVEGQKCYDLFKTPHCKTEKCACARAMQTDSVVTEQTIARPAEGVIVPIKYTGAPIKDAKGNIKGALEYVLDVTEEMQQQQMANEKIENLNAIPTPIMAIDTDFSVTYMNPAGAAVVGLTPDEVTGKKCYDLFKTPHCKTEKCACARAMQTDGVVSAETIARPAEGVIMPIKYTGAPIKDAKGNIKGALEFVLDITKEVQQRQMANEKIENLNAIILSARLHCWPNIRPNNSGHFRRSTMNGDNRFDADALKTLFHECRQCGVCCKKYRKIRLYPDEVDFIRKMGGHVGVKATLSQLRQRPLEKVVAKAKSNGVVHMIHPDDKGCVFLTKRNGKYDCRIYHHRPRVCRGFRCNMADNTFLDLFGQDATLLLGMDAFGRPMKPT